MLTTFFMSDRNEAGELRCFRPSIDPRARVLSMLCPIRKLSTLLNTIHESSSRQAMASNNGSYMSHVCALALGELKLRKSSQSPVKVRDIWKPLSMTHPK
jgi:hypothetical protein